MRMDIQQEQTAQNIINEYSEVALKHIFRHWGELDNAHKVAHHIAVARLNAPIDTTQALRTATQKCWGKEKEHKFLAKLFQALRIEVNNEMGVLKDFLQQTADVLHPNGRLVVMSYHSLEDRLVKNYMRSGNFEGVVEKDFFGNAIKPMQPIGTKATEPTEEETTANPRARSAKLRVAMKI
jgi:16S rRNA (cytosine1402-N4)-methyltransferase